MDESAWWKEFSSQGRDLEGVERRSVIVGSGKLSDESVITCLASDMGWKRPGRLDLWVDRALMVGIAYGDKVVLFLCGFLLGYVISALRGG